MVTLQSNSLCQPCGNRQPLHLESESEYWKIFLSRSSLLSGSLCHFGQFLHSDMRRQPFSIAASWAPILRGAFNKYVDPILPYFDHLPPSSGQLWTFYICTKVLFTHRLRLLRLVNNCIESIYKTQKSLTKILSCVMVGE